jgi:O-antigen/teichoic acid export membrane protein
MSDQQNSFRHIFKATGLFGGVQVITILITIFRSKLVAVLLGTTGAGILGLFNAPIGLITSITGLGISYSAIRDISQAAGTGDEKRIARTLISFRRWVIFTGLLGMSVTIILSPMLSKWTFGNKNYTWAFIWLSITLLLNAISAGQRSLMQGMRKLQSMAKATVLGSVFGLLASIPLYYYFGINGIVPALIISASIALLLSWYFAKKIPVARISITYRESIFSGFGMIKLGIILSISAQIGSLVTYLLNTYIGRDGGIELVGLYTSGTLLITTSVGLVFTAMGTDYYPRLAAVSKNDKIIRTIVNQQAIMSVLIILPIVLTLLAAMPLIIKLFLSKAFIMVIPFVNLTVLGVILRAVSYPIGYISFAKGDSRVFFWLEGVVSNLLNLCLSLVFYKIWGLIGIGIAYIVLYSIYLLIVYQVAKKRYMFSFEKEVYIVLFVSVLLSILSYFSISYLSAFRLYIVLIILILTGTTYSFYELNRRMDLIPIIKSYLRKFLKMDPQ